MDRPLRHHFDYTNFPGYAVLGLGGSFAIPARLPTFIDCRWRFTDSPAWTTAPIRSYRQGDIIYAFAIASEFVQQNLRQAHFHNPAIANQLPPLVAAPPPRPPEFEDDDEDEDDEEGEELTDDEIIAHAQAGDPNPQDNNSPLTLERINLSRTVLGLEPHPLPEPPPVMDLTGERLFCITFNGAPVGTQEEFLALAVPLLEGDGPLPAHQLWAAQWNQNPNAVMDQHAETQPILLACIDYTPLARPQAVDIIEMPAAEIQNQPVGTLIVRATIGAVLSGGMSNHFTFTEGGGIIINPDNPPSLEQGYEMMGRVWSTEDTAERLKSFSRWAQGALIADMERFFGDQFDLSALGAATGRAYNTLNAILGTHIRWAHRKRDSLSWTHHKEVDFSTLEDEDKEWVLDQSVRLGLNVAEQRKVQSYVRTYGRAQFDEDLPADRDAMLERLEVRSANRNYLFILAGVKYEYRGPFEHIPNGASIIINADTKQFLDREGRPEGSRSWEPVGVEVPYERGHAATNQERLEAAREANLVPRRRRQRGTIQRAAAAPVITPEEAVEATREADREMRQQEDDEPGIEQAHGPGALINEIIDRAQLLADGHAPVVVVPPGMTVEETRPEVAVTQPAGESFAAIRYDRDFYGEAGARRLVEGTGYPVGMPGNLQELLDWARTERWAPETLSPHYTGEQHFINFMEASDDYLVPF